MGNQPETVSVTTTKSGFNLSGSIRNGETKWMNEITKMMKVIDSDSIEIDLVDVDDIDTLGAAQIKEIVREAKTFGKEIILLNASNQIETALSHFSYDVVTPVKQEKEPSYAKLGDWFHELGVSGGHLLILISESIYWTIVGIWNHKGHRQGAALAQALSIGVGALPVVATVALLTGMVLSLQAAAQLRQFGANIYVADLVCISMAREMGPLMTAIILAGRSGASIAAEISTMNVSEETDALVIMGIRPIRYVVVPKLIGITLTAPLLSILATVIGILGGFFVSINALDLTPQSFYLEAVSALFLKDIVTGQIKSLVFAWLIVICAAFFGFRATGGPEGVGRATTSAVVASIFAVIVADAILGLIFYA